LNNWKIKKEGNIRFPPFLFWGGEEGKGEGKGKEKEKEERGIVVM